MEWLQNGCVVIAGSWRQVLVQRPIFRLGKPMADGFGVSYCGYRMVTIFRIQMEEFLAKLQAAQALSTSGTRFPSQAHIDQACSEVHSQL